MVLSKPSYKVVLREGAQTEYGTPTPVLIVEVPQECHHRLAMALLYRVAAAVEMLSVQEAWSMTIPSGFGLMGNGNRLRAVLKLELNDGTIAEAQRGVAILGRAAYTMALEVWVALHFQGEALGPVKDEPVSARKGRR